MPWRVYKPERGPFTLYSEVNLVNRPADICTGTSQTLTSNSIYLLANVQTQVNCQQLLCRFWPTWMLWGEKLDV